ncbi:MAG: hypothetical protein GY797_08115 [Deltaproteobacteria bacterium]|nr:hypothetical protein [Deltaproteobacteria bacterium]
MLRAIPDKWYSWNYNVFDNKTAIASITNHWDFSIFADDADYSIYSESFFSNVHILGTGGTVLARAEKPNTFSRSYKVDYNDNLYILEAKTFILWKFVLRKDGRIIGEMYPEPFFSRKATIDFPESLPLVIRIFLARLVITEWQSSPDGT